MSQRIPQQEQNQKGIPICTVCKLDCVPESAQSPIFILIEVLLLFFSLKLSFITLIIGYSFCRTSWKCPVCSRQQQINATSQNMSQELIEANKNIIFRMGKCMAIISINKFRIIAFIICSFIVYWYLTEQKPHKYTSNVNRTWENLVRDCGYQAGLENTFRTNQYYQKYSDQTQQWNLQGVYLQTIKSVKSLSYIKIKMNPTQFSNENTQDIILITQTNNLVQKPQKTDVVSFSGFFEGKQNEAFRFVALQFHKTQRKKPLQQIQTIVKKSLRKNQ